jgi:hypothetical protein
MSKEKAMAQLSAAMSMDSPEDIKIFVRSAISQLSTEPEPEDGLKLAAEMIRGSLETLEKNLLDYADSPEERAMKLAICESCLGTIKEYASVGLKGRTQGSLEVAEAIKKAQTNRSLQEFAEVQEMKAFMKDHDAAMEVKIGGEN